MLNQKYAARIAISDYMMETYPTEFIQRTIERMKQEGAINVFEEIYKHKGPVVVETHLEEWRDGYTRNTCYALHYRLTAVQTRNVVMPVFEFINHEGKRQWKCPACGMINHEGATYCGELHQHAVGCGRPKDL